MPRNPVHERPAKADTIDRREQGRQNKLNSIKPVKATSGNSISWASRKADERQAQGHQKRAPQHATAGGRLSTLSLELNCL